MGRRTLAAVLSVCCLFGGIGGTIAENAYADNGQPTKERVDAVLSNLRTALRSEGEDAQVFAIQQAAVSEDPRIITQLGRALRKKSQAVVEEAIRVLGSMKSEKALDQLHRLYRSNRKLGENENLFAHLLKEIGRHGNKKSVKILSDHPFRYLTRDVGKARLMGLGNIRHNDAVDALVKAGQKAGGRGISGVDSKWRGVFRKDFYVALRVLTGQDHGEIINDWARWWNQNKRNWKVAEQRPSVPEDVRRHWEAYWGQKYGTEDMLPSRGPNNTPLVRNDVPSDDDVKGAVDTLKAAFKSKDEGAITAAIERTGGVMHPKVVHELARGLRYKDRGVRMVTIDTLGWMKYEPALKQLHRFLRRRKHMYKQDEEMFALTLKSIGRHGSAKSIDVLSRHPFRGLTIASGRARIHGLGRIRDIRSVEALIKGSQLVGPLQIRGRRAGAEHRFTDEFLLSLTILTAQEFGRNRHEWQRWWHENKRTFKVPDQLPPLSEKMEKLYESYWGEPYDG